MGIPIVIATNGYGQPITEAANGYGQPVTIATNGYGVPVVIVASGGLPVVGSGGAASAYAPESETIFAAFTTPPTTARKDAIDAAVVALKSAGVWTKLDCMYVLAAADAQAGTINWKTPGSFNLTQVNTPTFAADLGFTGIAGGTKYLDSAWDPTNNVGNFTLNSASLHNWSNTASSVDSAYDIGVIDSPNTTTINERNASGNIETALNHAGAAFLSNASSLGLFSLSRTSSGSYTAYRNATSISPVATASVGLTALDFRICAVNTGFGSVRQISAAAWGGGLTGTEITSLYNALAAYMAAIKIVSAFTTPPTQARQALIQNCVTSLMTAGVWDKLDALYAFAAADSQAGKVNWKNPGTFNATEVNAPTFTADRGFTGASTKYLDSNFNPTTAPSPKYTQDSACIFVHASTNDTSGASAVSIFGSTDLVIHPRFSGDVYYVRMNTSTNTLTGASTNSTGFWSGTRSGASASEAFKNGVSLISGGPASIALASGNINILAGAGAYYTGQVSVSGFGQHLNSTEQTALYNALRTYLTGVGVP